ncbi:gastrula zinc finger protein XlCGF58.1-like isoform X2 [Eurosta solidaginis]|uniref:gastrula zinc finger protein XlCGF58.1-like isoform X2 n=1 Tax=Eurosta solidaginis TaxID=178769 RepID=UPI0035316A23
MVIECRACLNTNDTSFIRMDSNIGDGIDFFTCFCVCTQLNAQLNDGLPEVLCSNCSQDLQLAFNFVQNAKQADRLLRERLISKSISGDTLEALDKAGVSIVEESVTVLEGAVDSYVVEELLEDDTDEIEIDVNECDANITIKVETRNEESLEKALEEIEFIEEKSINTNVPYAIDEISEFQEEQINRGDYYAEDESDEEYLREYQDNVEENSNLDVSLKGSKWKCIECKRILCGDVSYEGHMNMHRSLRPYKCDLCTCAFRCKIMLERHIHLRHQQTPLDNVDEKFSTTNCYQCTKQFATSLELQEHVDLVHSNSSTVQCKKCLILPPFKRANIIEHLRTEHPEEYHKHFPTEEIPEHEPVKSTSWQCDVCKSYMSSEVALQDHRHAHQNERPNVCQFCSKRFTTTSNLRQHMRGVHTKEYEKLLKGAGDTIVQCEMCKKQLLQRNLDKHMALHSRKEREAKEAQTIFLCAYCSRECKNQKSLNQHEKSHQGASPDIIYICDDCGRSYATQHLLQQHRKQAHKDRDNFCPICGNAFKLKNQLSNHMKLHLEKNIQCPHCEKCYARRFDLDVHMRSHTGELPFACHLCDKRFAIKVRLTYHLQKHYGIKHRCKDCGAEFNSKQKLKAHSYKHTGMPYRCEKCDGHGFANRDVDQKAAGVACFHSS